MVRKLKYLFRVWKLLKTRQSNFYFSIFFVIYKLDRWSQDLKTAFTLKYCLFGGVKLTKNADPDNYSYSG